MIKIYIVIFKKNLRIFYRSKLYICICIYVKYLWDTVTRRIVEFFMVLITSQLARMVVM